MHIMKRDDMHYIINPFTLRVCNLDAIEKHSCKYFYTDFFYAFNYNFYFSPLFDCIFNTYTIYLL
jgi:hypothetical protein